MHDNKTFVDAQKSKNQYTGTKITRQIYNKKSINFHISII